MVALAALLLVPAFYGNFYLTVPPGMFGKAGKGSEYLIMGRLTYSRDHGLFSMGGIPGSCRIAPGNDSLSKYSMAQLQYRIFLEGLPYDEFSPHRSQLGFQALYLALLDRSFPFLTNEIKLQGFYLLNSVLFAAVLLFILLWVKRNAGFPASILLLLSFLLAAWFVAFGRNLWFVLWAFYLPFLATLLILEAEEKLRKDLSLRLYVISFTAIVVKLLMTSYEFITSALVTAFIPMVYYAVTGKWGLRKFILRSAVFSGIAVAAILISMIILSFQIKSIDGSFADGVRYISYSFSKRSMGDPEKVTGLQSVIPGTSETGKASEVISKSLGSSLTEVVGNYLRKDFINLRPLANQAGVGMFGLKLNYGGLFLIFGLFSLWGEIMCQIRGGFAERARIRAMNITFWVSMLGPLSWYIIFRGHSYIHTSLDMLVWHMPMVIIGFILTGMVISESIRRAFSAWGRPAGGRENSRPS